MTSISKRQAARILGEPTYTSTKCGTDGSTTKYTDTGKCVECERYRHAIRSGRVEGVDNRTPAQKAGEKPRKIKCGWNDEAGWTEEMRIAHSEAIRRGWARKRLGRSQGASQTGASSMKTAQLAGGVQSNGGQRRRRVKACLPPAVTAQRLTLNDC